MRTKGIAGLLALALLCAAFVGASFAEGADVTSAASRVYYAASSLSLEELGDAIAHAQGACTVATVNADGSPLLVGGSPALVGGTHIAFGWNNNVTMANMKRDGRAMMCYYLFDAEGQSKADRHRGARVKLELETDQTVIDALFAETPSLPPYATLMRITELLPLG